MQSGRYSIQHRFIAHLEEGLSSFIIDDDDSGESADVVSIEETADTITVTLWHCKHAGGATPGQRVEDLYVVCGQAQKSVKWAWSFANLVKHLLIRETEHRRGRPSRFIRGSSNALVTLRKAARRKFVIFKVGVVQPGLSRNNVPAEHLAIIGATSSFIECITDAAIDRIFKPLRRSHGGTSHPVARPSVSRCHSFVLDDYLPALGYRSCLGLGYR